MGHSTEDGQTHTAAAWMSCRLHGSRSLTRRACGCLRQRVFLKKKEKPGPRLFFTRSAIVSEHDLARLLPTTCCRGSRVVKTCVHHVGRWRTRDAWGPQNPSIVSVLSYLFYCPTTYFLWETDKNKSWTWTKQPLRRIDLCFLSKLLCPAW